MGQFYSVAGLCDDRKISTWDPAMRLNESIMFFDLQFQKR
jgi:hypothetical protein